ncbi:hypothetical protein V7152_17465 [Neobacillus drentensis]|uniref:hypothetical protein n=1 Tax=Neobacillus drentensis TaxID=220684 RepID=UPI002FFDB0D7
MEDDNNQPNLKIVDVPKDEAEKIVNNPKKAPIVAVVDSGIDMTNSDLKNSIYKPYSIIDPSQSLYFVFLIFSSIKIIVILVDLYSCS